MAAIPPDVDAVEKESLQSTMRSSSARSAFSHPDGSGQTHQLIAYLDAVAQNPAIREANRLSLAALALQPGSRALDIGCGTGEDVAAMAALVGPTGLSMGVDVNESMLVTARERHAAHTVCHFQQGDACALPFEDACFDAVRAERCLLHVPEPARMMEQMVRVTRPGGRIVLVDGDYETLVLDAPDRPLTRQISHYLTDSVVNGWAIRTVPRLLAERGCRILEVHAQAITARSFQEFSQVLDLSRVTARMVTAGLLDAQRADAWLKEIQERSVLLAALTLFVVVAQKDA